MSEIHVISENDLQGIKRSGRRIRALCPVHYSRDRDLSIAAYYEGIEEDEDEARLAGWGHCHSAKCGATVLVKEWNPRAAKKYGAQVGEGAQPKVTVSGEEVEQADERQRAELVALNKVYESMQAALHHSRCVAYLAGRGLEGELLDLLATLGVGYMPPANEWRSPPPAQIAKWCDRVIFPFTTAQGERGYIGRTLHLWQSGMDENQHKHVIDAYNDEMQEQHHDQAYKHQFRRWEKTYRSGFFHAEALAGEHISIVEGSFDAIPLLAVGITDVVSVAGTHIDIKAIPLNVCSITLAFDADAGGKVATTKVINELARKGITPQICTPPDDGRGQDWSERYRLHGRDGLAVLMPDDDMYCKVCGAGVEHYSPVGVPYCGEHYDDEHCL